MFKVTFLYSILNLLLFTVEPTRAAMDCYSHFPVDKVNPPAIKIRDHSMLRGADEFRGDMLSPHQRGNINFLTTKTLIVRGNVIFRGDTIQAHQLGGNEKPDKRTSQQNLAAIQAIKWTQNNPTTIVPNGANKNLVFSKLSGSVAVNEYRFDHSSNNEFMLQSYQKIKDTIEQIFGKSSFGKTTDFEKVTAIQFKLLPDFNGQHFIEVKTTEELPVNLQQKMIRYMVVDSLFVSLLWHHMVSSKSSGIIIRPNGSPEHYLEFVKP